MNSVSVTQQQYVKQKKRQIQLLKTIRILILIAFLMVWELATNLHYIDGFFFSSPSRILLCIWRRGISLCEKNVNPPDFTT